MYRIEIQLTDGTVHKYPQVLKASWGPGFSYVTLNNEHGETVEVMYPNTSIKFWVETEIRRVEEVAAVKDGAKKYILGSWMDKELLPVGSK